MKNLFKQIPAIMIAGGIAAIVIVGWLLNRLTGFIKGLPLSIVSGAAIVLVFVCIGLLITVIASIYARTGAQQPKGGGFFKMLFAPERATPGHAIENPDRPIAAAHGNAWYDDKWYRTIWIAGPLVAVAAMVLWFWIMPADGRSAQWAKPLDPGSRAAQLLKLRDTAKTSRQAMDSLQRIALGGEPLAQFYMGALYDPDLKLSVIVQPDLDKAVDWYSKAASQGDQTSLNNLALTYARGIYTRVDYTRACDYARKLNADGIGSGLLIKGDCYSRGLGGTPIDLAQAADAYEAASNKGNARAGATLGYFYENGLGGRPRNNEMARKYYQAAAAAGDVLGLHNLGAAYNSGLLGLQRDGTEAARLIMQALEEKYDVTVQSLTKQPEVWSFEFWQSMQRRLTEKGLYDGPTDGRVNFATLDAVKKLGKN
jgi:TPR repeat protein